MTFYDCAAAATIPEAPSVPELHWGKEGWHRSAATARTPATPPTTRIPVPVALSLPPPLCSPSAPPPSRGHSHPNPPPRQTATATAAADAASPVRVHARSWRKTVHATPALTPPPPQRFHRSESPLPPLRPLPAPALPRRCYGQNRWHRRRKGLREGHVDESVLVPTTAAASPATLCEAATR